MVYRILRLLLVCCLLALLVGGCDSGEGSGGGADADANAGCPGGTIEGPDGECLRPGADTDNGDDGGPSDVSPTDGDEGDGGDVASDTPGCAIGECPEGKFCHENECVVGMECDAGSDLGCAGDSQKRVCLEKGLGWERVDCPDAQPNCWGGECRATVCEPGSTFCKDDAVTLMQCSEDGMSTETVKTCRTRCQGGECISGCGGIAKESYIGCGFYAVDLANYEISCDESRSRDACRSEGKGRCDSGTCTGSNSNAQQFGVTVSNPSERVVDVEVTESDGTTVTSGTVGAGELKVFDVPRQDTVGSALSNKSYQIDASGSVTVHQFNPKNRADVFSNDASLLLPSDALGTNYTVVGWPSKKDYTFTNLAASRRAYVTIVGVETGTTTVDVETPSAVISGNGVAAMSPGDTETFALDQGQVLQLMTPRHEGEDLTGMTIQSDQNVAVFSGHECANVPLGANWCDHLEQQLFPVDSWGKEYVLGKFAPRGDERDVFRVIAAEDETTLQTTPSGTAIDGVTLDAGEVRQFQRGAGWTLSADKPVAVAQFMVGSTADGVRTNCVDSSSELGDPAFLLNPSTTQFRKDYVVYTPREYEQDWLSILAKQGETVRVDGTALSGTGTEIPGTSWRILHEKVEPGVHRVEANTPVGLNVYGYDCNVSYAYPGGLDL